MADLQLLLKNRWSIKYLDDYIQKYINENILYPLSGSSDQSNTYIVAKLLLSLTIIKLCINRDRLTLPLEVWGKICDHIENDIEYFMPKYVKIDKPFTLELYNNNKSFFLNDFVKKTDPVELLKYIKVGDFLLRKNSDTKFGMSCEFLIVIDINKEYNIIKFIVESSSHSMHIENLEKNYKKITSVVSSYSMNNESTIFYLIFHRQKIYTLNFYDFLLSSDNHPFYVLDMKKIISNFNIDLIKFEHEKLI
jgi:hypothetical protein